MNEMGEAEQWGIELAYTDTLGNRQTADPEVVRRVLASISAGCQRHDTSERHPDISEPAYQGAAASRHWLLTLQLYAVRSGTNWGHGDFSDLAALIALTSDFGAAGIGLNPLHALFPDRPDDASPYAPSSRLFLNPLYIDVAAAPGFPGISELGLADELARLRATELVEYEGVARVKMPGLRAAYRGFRNGSTPRDDFDAFRDERGTALTRFAAFETLRQKFKTAWWEWPQEWRQPTERALDRLHATDADELGFHEYIQWVADRQLRQCRDLAKQRGCVVGLYSDLAVGVHAAGADVWADQSSFLTDLSVGAPPDALNRSGQDWGLTTFNPHCLAARDFEPFRQLLDATMRYAGAIRIDHVLGLNRIYVVPRGCSATQGVYLRYPFESLLAVVAQASNRQCCIVIGEDLGTVPEGFRQKLSDWGLWTYVVVLFEREHDGGFRASDRYPSNALATFATHDLATYAGWSTGHDLRIKRGLGIEPGETDEERGNAARALHDALARYRHDDHEFLAIVRHLAESPSRLIAISAEDILGVVDQINVPGTVHEHPNWRRKLPATIEQLKANERLQQVAAIFEDAARGASARR